MLYNPYSLHSIRQSRISTLNLSWVQAFTQNLMGADSEMRRSPLIPLGKVNYNQHKGKLCVSKQASVFTVQFQTGPPWFVGITMRCTRVGVEALRVYALSPQQYSGSLLEPTQTSLRTERSTRKHWSLSISPCLCVCLSEGDHLSLNVCCCVCACSPVNYWWLFLTSINIFSITSFATG